MGGLTSLVLPWNLAIISGAILDVGVGVGLVSRPSTEGLAPAGGPMLLLEVVRDDWLVRGSAFEPLSLKPANMCHPTSQPKVRRLTEAVFEFVAQVAMVEGLVVSEPDTLLRFWYL